MTSWKALFAGTLTTLLLGHASFSQRYPELSGLVGSASSAIGVLGYLMVMAAGGCVTARFTRRKAIEHVRTERA